MKRQRRPFHVYSTAWKHKRIRCFVYRHAAIRFAQELAREFPGHPAMVLDGTRVGWPMSRYVLEGDSVVEKEGYLE